MKQAGVLSTIVMFITLFSSLPNLDIEANGFYHRAHQLYGATLLTWCYTQHALQTYIGSEINHIKHLIKIQFVNKFINLPSISKDKSLLFLCILKIRNQLIFAISTMNLIVVLYLNITH